MDVKLRKLGTPALLRRAVKSAALVDRVANPMLAQTWDVLNAGPGVASRADLFDFIEAAESPFTTKVNDTDLHDLPQNWVVMKDAVQAMVLSYPELHFPLVDAGGGVFRDGIGQSFQFSEIGIGYLSERIPAVRYGEWTKQFRAGNWRRLQDLMDTEGKHLIGKPLVAAVVDNRVAGVLSHYHPVPHQELLALFEAEGLAKYLLGWELTETHLQLDLKVVDVASNLIAVLRVRNGHSGHFALRFSAGLVASNYDWEFSGTDRKGRKRHLSNVRTIIEQLKTAVDDAATTLFEENLRAMTYAEVETVLNDHFKRLTLRQEQLLHQAEDAKPDNALDFVNYLAPKASVKGWASAVASILDPVISKAVGA